MINVIINSFEFFFNILRKNLSDSFYHLAFKSGYLVTLICGKLFPNHLFISSINCS